MSDITWQAPPMDGRRGTSGRASKWPAIAADLRARPGEWALVHTGSQSAATLIVKGQYQGMEPGEFEATSRRTSNGKSDIYARYVGEVSA